MKKTYFIALAIIFNMGVCGISQAAESPDDFAKRFVMAINSHDTIKIKELIYSKSLECLTGENEIILTQDMDKFSTYTIPEKFTSKVKENPPEYVPIWTSFFKDKFDYPLQPTHQFQIDWTLDSSSSRISSNSIIREVAFVNDSWSIILPCPRPGTVQWMADMKSKAMIENDKNKTAAQNLVSDLKDPLRSRILNLLDQDERIKASHLLTQELKVTTTIAMTALDILSPRFNRNMDMAELKKLAESGQASAQYELAVRYFDGKNTPKDIAQSVEWLKKAVAQNHVNSQLFLGGLYEAGNGVPMDSQEAASLYLKAALKESSQAQFNLGWLYESGSGVEKNLSEAYKWYTLSGVTAAVTSIAAKMTPEQIETGKKAAQNWSKK